jgi:hypothetical protein
LEKKTIFCNKTPQNKPKECLQNTPLNKKKTFSKNIVGQTKP